jgi:hypothetical protein
VTCLFVQGGGTIDSRAGGLTQGGTDRGRANAFCGEPLLTQPA